MRRAARTDANQKHIVEGLRRSGAFVLIMSQLKNAFDILVVYQGQYYCMELKDINQPKSAQKLTPGEIECKEKMERAGGTYYVVRSVTEALKIIGVD